MSRPTGLPASLTQPRGGSYSGRTANARPSYGKLPTPGFVPNANRPAPGNIASLPSRPRLDGGTRPSPGNLPNVGTLPATGGLAASLDRPNYVDLPMGSGTFDGIKLPTAMPTAPGSLRPGAPLAGGAAAEFLNDRPSNKLPGSINRPSSGHIANTLPVRPGGDLARHRPDRIQDRTERNDWREDHRDAILAYMRHYTAGDNDDWYDDDWWLLHRVNEMYETDFEYWKPAAWSGVTNWVDSEWTQPIYYAYGDNVYYENGSVYYGDKAIASEEDYALQAEAIATNVPKTKPAADDWMPLGVFALTADGKPSGAEPTMFLQLAVSKQGVISGTFQNTAANTVQAVEGMVDKQTQRAAWAGVGKTRPLMETGVVNLTQEFAPALVHFPDGTTQQVLLVRMEEPAAQPANDAASQKSSK
jgi:hypothetical protein